MRVDNGQSENQMYYTMRTQTKEKEMLVLSRFATFRSVYRNSWRSILHYTIHNDWKLPLMDILWVLRGK